MIIVNVIVKGIAIPIARERNALLACDFFVSCKVSTSASIFPPNSRFVGLIELDELLMGIHMQCSLIYSFYYAPVHVMQ
ncbi:hypothetical protein P8452_12755 [Trifolium repens]|nr:hypothetical protein P8452_12755 [Trifolium repens]